MFNIYRYEKQRHQAALDSDEVTRLVSKRQKTNKYAIRHEKRIQDIAEYLMIKGIKDGAKKESTEKQRIESPAFRFGYCSEQERVLDIINKNKYLDNSPT